MKRKILLLAFTLLLIATPARSNDYSSETLSSTAVQVNSGPTRIFGFNIINLNSVPIYVHKYDALSGSVTVGTTVHKSVWAIPANGALYLPVNGQVHGIYLTGLTIAATTTATSSGSTAPSTPIIINIGYQSP